ncbi:MAG: nucleoid-associated protein [Bdellovibrionaceae bacterium]|nr:nucleoid-associated protein [Pseudobdellovibrionaceae bacterium]
MLTASEKESFEIERFIFHIIIQSEPAPIYLDEVLLDAEQVKFFKKRFTEISEGIQHVFKDKPETDFVKYCHDLIDNPEKDFIRVSRILSASFKKEHLKNTVDGVFITALVTVEGSRKLIFLLKLDNRKVYQYKLHKSKALLKEIKDTFVEDKKAIQKSALVDISDYYSWDVLAKERSPGPSRGIRDYFAKFLDVVEKDTPSKLTERAVSTVRLWAIENKADLDPTQDVSTYKSRGIAYLSSTPRFKTEDFINAVVGDSDELRMESLSNSLKNMCDLKGLSGQSFAPNRNSLTKNIKRNIRRTAEGVKIEWEGNAADSLVTIPTAKDVNDNLFHILIRTAKIDILDA